MKIEYLQVVQVLAFEPVDLSSIPRVHMMEKMTLTCCSLTSACVQHLSQHAWKTGCCGCRSLLEHLTKSMKALGPILAPQKNILLDTEFLSAVSDLLNLPVQPVLVWMLGLQACAT